LRDPDKTEKVVPLSELLAEKPEPELQEPGKPLIDDESISSPGVFKRIALWMLGKNQ